MAESTNSPVLNIFRPTQGTSGFDEVHLQAFFLIHNKTQQNQIHHEWPPSLLSIFSKTVQGSGRHSSISQGRDDGDDNIPPPDLDVETMDILRANVVSRDEGDWEEERRRLELEQQQQRIEGRTFLRLCSRDGCHPSLFSGNEGEPSCTGGNSIRDNTLRGSTFGSHSVPTSKWRCCSQ